MERAEINYLPDQQKKDLCLDLLNEFGAGRVRIRGDELQHNCTLPYGGHSDGNSYAASVNYRKLEFNCYVCGYGGPVSWWIAANRGEETDQTQQWLRKKLGIGSTLPINDLLHVLDDIFNPPVEKRVLPKFPEKILDRWTDWPIFHPYLTDPVDKGGREIPEANLARFRIGYADEDQDFKYYQRIIIPVFWQGQLVGWQARALAGREDDPDFAIKYKNSLGFPGDHVLYGDITERWAVCVESPMSVLRHCHQVPILATLGSNITPTKLRLLERFDRLILFNENDKAGWKMSRKVSNALSRSVRVDVVQNPYNNGVDPADLDDDTFMRLVDSAVPASIWTPKPYKAQVPYIRK